MIKYLARYGVIYPVEVEQENDHTVVYRSPVSGRLLPELKQTEDSCWHDTWEEAKDALLARAAWKMDELKLKLAAVELDARRIRKMKPEI